MSLYADSADLLQLEEMVSLGIFTGITTNQKILLKANPDDYVSRIAALTRYPVESVSVELTGDSKDYDGLVSEAKRYHSICPEKIAVKVPMWPDGTGVALANELEKHGIHVNMTCLMNVNQAILGCLAGCTYVSLFYNRMADYYGGKKGQDKETAGMVFEYTRLIKDRFGYESRIIAGSIRKPEDVAMCLLRGADIVTVPYNIYKQLASHPKTIETIAEFDEAWKQYKQKS